MLRVMGSVVVDEEVEESGEELIMSSKRERSMSSRGGASGSVTCGLLLAPDESLEGASTLVGGEVSSSGGESREICGLLFFFRPYFFPRSRLVFLCNSEALLTVGSLS